MKRLMYASMAALLAVATTVPGQSSWTIVSPDSMVQGMVQLANLNGQADYPSGVRLYYSIKHGKASPVEVVPASPMGLVRSDRNFVDGLAFVSEGTQRTIDENYTMVTGKRRICRNYCNEKVLSFQTTTGSSKLDVIIRAYNDGFAFRYRFPETGGSSATVTGEATGIRLPTGSLAYIVAYDVFQTWGPGMENYWNNGISINTASSQVYNCMERGPNGWSMPALFKTPTGHYALIFETDVTETFCGVHLLNPTNGLYRFSLPLSAEGNNQGSVNPSSSLPWTMPWRVIVVGANPGPILETTLATDLATPSKVSDVSWIKPGRASWSWYTNENVRVYGNITPFIDLAQQMGWEYSLVDVDWNLMTGGDYRSLQSYGASRNVAISLWYNAGGSTNIVSGMGPRDRMLDANRANELRTISSAGIKGIKVDFFHSEKQSMMQLYLNICKDAAANKIAVVFHGCTYPRGWQRTYPNLMSMEGVRGSEFYKYDGNFPAGEPARNTIHPFARNTIGSMDFTPVIFSTVGNAHRTTYAHELALSVVFESGIQHFPDRPSAYTSLPTGVRTFLQQVPVVWENTKYLDGTPGSYVVLARKQADTCWYIGGINGQSSSRNVTIPLDFLQQNATYSMTQISDGSSNSSFNVASPRTVTPESSLSASMSGNGGFVARLKRTAVSVTRMSVAQAILPSLVRGIIRSADGVFILPAGYRGKAVELTVYDLNGKLVTTSIIHSRTITSPETLRIPSGAYVATFRVLK
ncbi:MAG: glycoside hydrolase family 97 catalytic domain-containing protein [Chitinispirillaceae bacterium]|nr:glycoside hydrolase family 97 catalytic domain-containing protein [Chitinispirillaceae bacterium]